MAGTAPQPVTSKEALDKLIRAKWDGKIVMVDVDKIYESNFDVRVESRDEDRVEMFESIWKNEPEKLLSDPVFLELTTDDSWIGPETPEHPQGQPIPKGVPVIIDGRHRVAGAKKAGIKKIPAKFLSNLNQIERVEIAMGGHTGPQPHTKLDYKTNALKLFVAGYTRTQIRSRFAPYLTKKVLDDIMNHASRDYDNIRMREALAAVASGMSLEDVVKNYQVTLRALAAQIRGDKNYKKTSQTITLEQVKSAKGNVVSSFKTTRKSMGSVAKTLMALYEANTINASQGVDIFNLMVKEAEEASKTAYAARARFKKFVQFGE